MEDNPILLSYDSVAGGTVKKDREHHMRDQSEAVLLMHKASKSFTCNVRVVPSDIHGLANGPTPKAKQTLFVKTLPNGAPDGGPRVAFPPQMCAFLIGRFTMPGEHAVGIGMGRTDFLPTALERGRSVEMFQTRGNEAEQAALRRTSDAAFRLAFNKGTFQFRMGSEVFVGPRILPSGVPGNNILPLVLTFLEDAPAADPDYGVPAELGVAKQVAKKAGYELEDGDTGVKLIRKKPSSRKGKAKASPPSDLPLFGDFKVYDTVEQAVEAVDEEDIANQCIRLVQVADTKQLKVMLQTGTELCKPKAGLYLRVSKTCPLYWVTWEDDNTVVDLDLVSDIPQFGNRETVLGKLDVNSIGGGGVRARLMRKKDAFSRELCLCPGRRVVGAACFGPSASGPSLDVNDDEEGEEDGVGEHDAS
ncbi:unnamed protein product [Pylaiella littoralis]